MPTWRVRDIQCPDCGSLKDAAKIQLRSRNSPAGFKMLWCTAGKHRSWANKWKCACGILWQNCKVHTVDPMQHRGPLKASGQQRTESRDIAHLPKQCILPTGSTALQHGNTGKIYKRKLGIESEAPQLRGANFDSIASDPRCPKLAAKIAAFKRQRDAA